MNRLNSLLTTICFVLTISSTLAQSDKMMVGEQEIYYQSGNPQLAPLPIGNVNAMLTDYPDHFSGATSDAIHYVYTGEHAEHSQNIWYDVNRSIKFFVIDGNVYNHEGLMLFAGRFNPVIQNQLTYFSPWLYEGHSECIITRVPDKCNSFNPVLNVSKL